MSLTDTQLVILSAASQRPDHAAILPTNLKGSAAKNVVAKLLSQKLLQELIAKDSMPVWRRGDDNRPFGLRITKAGLKAIEIDDAGDKASDDAVTASNTITAADAEKSKPDDRPAGSTRPNQTKSGDARRQTRRTSPETDKSDSKQGPYPYSSATSGRRHARCADGGNWMAEALGTWISGGDCTQEIEAAAAFRENRRHQNLSDRSNQRREGHKGFRSATGLINVASGNGRRGVGS